MNFEQTNIDQIVDQYIAAYREPDTTTIEHQIRSRAEYFGNDGVIYISIFDDKLNNLEICNTLLDENEGVITPYITLKRIPPFTKVKWYQLLQDLFSAGYTVSDNHKRYVDSNESVCLKRPDALLEANSLLVDKMVSEATNKALSEAHAAYFDADKVAKFVEEYQLKERNAFYAEQQRIVTSTLQQKLQAKTAVNALQTHFVEYVDGKQEIAFNELKQALGSIDNVTAKQLLECNGYHKETINGKAVWVKQ